MHLSRYLPKRTEEQEESVQILDALDDILLHEGHPVPPS